MIQQQIAALVLAAAAVILPADVPAQYDTGVSVRLLDSGSVNEVNLRDYLISVVLQEMPASFEMEALKAQAVAARTFTVRSIYAGGAHAEADVCGDPACCQCYLDAAEGAVIYGDGYAAAQEKVRQAVEETDGQVMTCGGELIEAVYFSSTCGSTESAAAVWGNDVSYLQAVSSPEEDRISEQRIPAETFRTAFGDPLPGTPASWFGAVSYTDGGAVDTLEICGIPYTGTRLRGMFSLRSTHFTVAVEGDEIVFEVHGAGHGVGMSQYGADAMAAAGESYRAILTHYYKGAELKALY